MTYFLKTPENLSSAALITSCCHRAGDGICSPGSGNINVEIATLVVSEQRQCQVGQQCNYHRQGERATHGLPHPSLRHRCLELEHRQH